MKTAASSPELTFAIPKDGGFPFILFLCVLGSLLAHAATFLLFQVVYPERVTIPQPPPQVSLLTPSSPENVALLRWIEAEDPAVIANGNPVVPPGLAVVRYRPSFLTPRTAPLGVPAEPPHGIRFPRAEDKLAVSRSERATPAPSVPSVAVQTSITYSGLLSGRAVAKNPPLDFRVRSHDPVEPTTVLLGVSSDGQVQFVTLQLSSGDSDLDGLALSHLRRVSFETAPDPIQWGFATINWGADAYTATKDTSP